MKKADYVREFNFKFDISFPVKTMKYMKVTAMFLSISEMYNKHIKILTHDRCRLFIMLFFILNERLNYKRKSTVLLQRHC